MLSRRHILPAALASSLAPRIALAAPQLDAGAMGLRSDGREDVTSILQRAIDTAATSRATLILPPGTYRTGRLRLPPFCRIEGVRGASRLVFAGGEALLSAQGAEGITLTGLTLDGGGAKLPDNNGLATFIGCESLVLTDCAFTGAMGHGLALDGVSGRVEHCAFTNSAEAALFSLNAKGLTLSDNRIAGAGNNGLLVWRSEKGEDGTIVSGNRISRIEARRGGSGQNGNGVNVYRAGNVQVINNRIDTCAFSAIRANTTPGIVMRGNVCTNLKEVALYAEFAFEGALIEGNSIDGAAVGIAATNLNQGGRMAVIANNIVRNLSPTRPAGTDPNDPAGVGLYAEADATITGNVVEGAPYAAIMLGWGAYLRDVAVSGNTLRASGYGIAVSTAPGAGKAVLSGNAISGAAKGAIVALEWKKQVSGDLALDPGKAPGNVVIVGASGR